MTKAHGKELLLRGVLFRCMSLGVGKEKLLKKIQILSTELLEKRKDRKNCIV